MSKKNFKLKDKYDDENVLYVFGLHPIVMRKGLILFSICIVLGMLPVFVKPEMYVFYLGLIAGALLGSVLMFPYYFTYKYSNNIVTDQRIIQIKRKGFFNKSVVDLSLDQIQMVNYQVEGLTETVMNFGTLVIQTYVGDLVLDYIHRPAKVQLKIQRTLRDLGIETGGRD